MHKVKSYKTQLKLEARDKERLNSISSIIIRNMNECSIVFDCEEDLIALGDISPRIIGYLKKTNKFSEGGYKVVKVQHHGTRRYWSADILKAKVYCVSNSGAKMEKWSIYEKYGLIYSDKMNCTNDKRMRCGCYSKRKCKFCNIGIGGSKICLNIYTL